MRGVTCHQRGYLLFVISVISNKSSFSCKSVLKSFQNASFLPTKGYFSLQKNKEKGHLEKQGMMMGTHTLFK